MNRKDREAVTGLGARLRDETSAALTAMLVDGQAAWPRAGEMTAEAAATLLDDATLEQAVDVTVIYFNPTLVDVPVPSVL